MPHQPRPAATADLACPAENGSSPTRTDTTGALGCTCLNRSPGWRGSTANSRYAARACRRTSAGSAAYARQNRAVARETTPGQSRSGSSGSVRPWT